jgi:hypothetical protein
MAWAWSIARSVGVVKRTGLAKRGAFRSLRHVRRGDFHVLSVCDGAVVLAWRQKMSSPYEQG